MIAGLNGLRWQGLFGTIGVYSGPIDPNNPDNAPDYDEWGFDDKWLAPEWMLWHAALKKKYGKEIADYAWAASWEDNPSFAEVLNERTFNSEFRDWAKAEGLYDALYYGAGVIMKPIGTAGEVAGDIIEAAKSVAKAAKNAGTLAEYAIPIGLGILAIVWLVSTSKKIAK